MYCYLFICYTFNKYIRTLRNRFIPIKLKANGMPSKSKRLFCARVRHR